MFEVKKLFMVLNVHNQKCVNHVILKKKFN
jgi:hypothetical protein